MSKDLYFFLAHLDDFEISCIGYLSKHKEAYDSINIFVATKWDKKSLIWSENLKLIQEELDVEINYHNFQYDQRTLMSNLDNLKDDFYKKIDFNRRFDLVSHDENDCHTDHAACNMISMGMFKYANKFVTVYSPSSRDFRANCWVGLANNAYSLKKKCIDKYSIASEQSYSKMGYYIQDENHYNIGKASYIENFTYQDYKYYETYRILKEVY